jgi:hypothetical protein
VEETGVTRENHESATSHWQTLSHNVTLAWVGFELTTVVCDISHCMLNKYIAHVVAFL